MNGQRCFRLDLIGDLATCFALRLGPLRRRLGGLGVGFSALFQFGDFPFDRDGVHLAGVARTPFGFKTLPLAVNRGLLDPSTLMCRGTGFTLHRRPGLGQVACTRLGMGAVLRRTGGFGFGLDAGKSFTDGPQFGPRIDRTVGWRGQRSTAAVAIVPRFVVSGAPATGFQAKIVFHVGLPSPQCAGAGGALTALQRFT